MPTTQAKPQTAFARIAAAHLPGLVHELAGRLGCAADDLAVHERQLPYRSDRASFTSVAEDAARVASFARVLDQIGWQTDEAVTLIGDPEFLRATFEEIREDALQQLTTDENSGGSWTDPEGARANFAEALAGAEQVLRQLDSGRIEV